MRPMLFNPIVCPVKDPKYMLGSIAKVQDVKNRKAAIIDRTFFEGIVRTPFL
jgi:hypothetical protein